MSVTGSFKTAFQHFATVAGQAGIHLAYSLAVLTLIISAIMMLLQQDDLNKMYQSYFNLHYYMDCFLL